jgi:hypothetical protein
MLVTSAPLQIEDEDEHEHEDDLLMAAAGQ